jgi:hypothetical protein
MEKKNHTPLPWVKDFGGTIGHIKSIALHEKGFTPTVCQYDKNSKASSISDKEAQANAELIVTAVNSYLPMLEALKSNHEKLLWCYDIISHNCPKKEWLTDLRTEMYNTLQAIALAENNEK